MRKKMKIAVIDIAASNGGAKSILLDFYNYVVYNNGNDEWFFFVGSSIICEQSNIHVIVKSNIKKSWINRLKYDFWDAQADMKAIQPDVILNFQNTSIRYKQARQYLYVHQPIPFQKIKKYSFLKPDERVYAVYQYLIGGLIKKSIAQADRIFVQTEWMRKAVQKYCHSSKVVVISPEIKVDNNLDKKKSCVLYNYFFYPAAYIPYKNHEIIIQACKQLLLEGDKNFHVDFTIYPEQIDTLGVEQISCVGTQSRDTILSWYKERILIFPSYIETFGMPLAEARRMNGIIFAARTPFALEILDGYTNAFFFDPFNAEELVALMKKALHGRIRIQNDNNKIEECNSWGKLINELKG